MNGKFALLAAFLLSGCVVVDRGPAQDEWIAKQTALQVAVFMGSLEDIADALSAGAEINSPIGCGDFLPLEGAIAVDDVEKFDFLIERGARANDRCLRAAERSKNKVFLEVLKSQPEDFIR